MATKKTTTKKTATKTTKSKKPAAKPRPEARCRASDPGQDHGPPRDPYAPAVGSTLKRSFKGNDIAVKVTADGYQFDGQTFGSLTAVARHITGYAISGPVFFKLVEPKNTTKPEA